MLLVRFAVLNTFYPIPKVKEMTTAAMKNVESTSNNLRRYENRKILYSICFNYKAMLHHMAMLHYATLCCISRLTTMSPIRKVTEKAEFYTTLSYTTVKGICHVALLGA